MLLTGLVSVTFRRLPIAEIVSLAADARLEGVEWGGDIHVPPGDLSRAREARALTAGRGLQVTAYGSYYRLGAGGEPFAPVLESAVALGAPTIRIWAGQTGSRSADQRDWERVTLDGRRIADMAAGAGLSLTLEFHNDTLNDSAASCLQLLSEIGRTNVLTGWQPLDGLPCAENAHALRTILPHVGNVHVFHWSPGRERRPLAAGAEDWAAYIALLAGDARVRHLLLEFVRDDSPAGFRRDARTLRDWLGMPGAD